MEIILSVIGPLLTRLPLILVGLVAIFLAVKDWSKHPRVSLFTVIGFSLILLMTLISWTASSFLPLSMARRGLNVSNIGQLFTLLNCVTGLIDAAGWVLIIMAIFGERRGQEEPAVNGMRYE